MAKRFTVEAVFKAKDRFTGVVRKLNTSIAGVTKRVTANLKRVAVGAAGLAASFGVAARAVIGSGADFEQAISNVGAVMLKSRGEIADLEKEARRLGKTTQFTAGQVAGGMEVMARAGFESSEILSGMQGVLAATAAEGGEIAPVMEVVASTLKGMGLEAAETARVADVLAMASANTKSSILSLGESMKTLGPVARQLGVSLEEAVAMAGLLQDVGLDASEAGTATATMLTKLSKPSAAMAGKLRKMGVAFQDVHGNALPVPEILENMAKAADASGGNMEQLALFADLVGLRGQKAALNLQKMAREGRMGELVDKLQGASGAAQDMADIRMDTTLGDWELFKSAVDGVYQSIFDTQNGPLRDLIQSMTEWISQNGELVASGVADFLKTIIDNLDRIVFWIKVLGGAVAAFYMFATAVKVVSTTITVVSALMKAFNMIVLITQGLLFVLGGTIALPFIIGIAAIAAIGAALWYFWDEVVAFGKLIGDFFVGIWDGIKDTFLSVISFIAQKLIDFITGPARLAIMAAEKVGLVSAGTSDRITDALTINSPQERTGNSVSESRSTVQGEVTVKAPGMKTEVTKAPPKASPLRIAASGGM